MTRFMLGVAVAFGVIAGPVSPVSAQSSNQTAQVLIIIPERPDLAEAEARAEGRIAEPTPASQPAADAILAPVAPPGPALPPPMPRALLRLTTMQRSAGRTQVLHTQIEPL